jgi:hypothetical protein
VIESVRYWIADPAAEHASSGATPIAQESDLNGNQMSVLARM